MATTTLYWYYAWRALVQPIKITDSLNQAVANKIREQIASVQPNGDCIDNNNKVVKQLDIDIPCKMNDPTTGVERQQSLKFVAKLQKNPESYLRITSDVRIIVDFDDGSRRLGKQMNENNTNTNNTGVEELIESKIEFNPYQPSNLFQKAIKEFENLTLSEKEKIRDELIHFLSSEDATEAWSKKNYGRIMPIVELTKSKSPVLVFVGDPGTGKTALAKSIGAVVSQKLQACVNTWLISLSLRGEGYQGRAATMVTKLFNSAKISIQRENKPLLIIFDEAEAMVGSRKDAGNGEGAQENIAIVNAILRGIDQLSTENCPAAVIFISNTPLRIDEALMRRCTHYSFPRPDDDTRKQIFAKSLDGFSFSNEDIQELVNATKPKVGDQKHFAYTASDIVTVILYQAIRICTHEGRELDKQTILDVCNKSYPTGFPRA